MTVSDGADIVVWMGCFGVEVKKAKGRMQWRSGGAVRGYFMLLGMHRPDIIHEAEVCLASEMIKQDEQASPPITNRSHVRIS